MTIQSPSEALEERVAIKMESMGISEIDAWRQAIDEATQSSQGADMHPADLLRWIGHGDDSASPR